MIIISLFDRAWILLFRKSHKVDVREGTVAKAIVIGTNTTVMRAEIVKVPIMRTPKAITTPKTRAEVIEMLSISKEMFKIKIITIISLTSQCEMVDVIITRITTKMITTMTLSTKETIPIITINIKSTQNQ